MSEGEPVVHRGGDPTELRRLAVRMEDEAAAMERHLSRLQVEADSMFWQGSDADRFRSRLDGEHASAVTQTVQAVRHAASQLRRQAAEQERASAT